MWSASDGVDCGSTGQGRESGVGGGKEEQSTLWGEIEREGDSVRVKDMLFSVITQRLILAIR